MIVGIKTCSGYVYVRAKKKGTKRTRRTKGKTKNTKYPSSFSTSSSSWNNGIFSRVHFNLSCFLVARMCERLQSAAHWMTLRPFFRLLLSASQNGERKKMLTCDDNNFPNAYRDINDNVFSHGSMCSHYLNIVLSAIHPVAFHVPFVQCSMHAHTAIGSLPLRSSHPSNVDNVASVHTFWFVWSLMLFPRIF